MDRVRSSAMGSSGSGGGNQPRIVPARTAPRQLRFARKSASGKGKSDAEAFAATALAAHVGVAEAECLVEPLPDEVDLGPVDEFKAPGVHEDPHALAVEDLVLGLDRVSVIDDVGKAGAPGLAHRE